MLSEYYKYHKDIPRLFIMPQCKTMNRYHDKRRKIEYRRITRMLQIDEGNQNEDDSQNSSSDMDEDDEDRRGQNYIPRQSMERILEPLEESIQNQKRNQTNNTLQELRSQLNDIISQKSFSTNQNEENHYLHDQDGEQKSLGNLSNFLKYLKVQE